jgi:hypothetical protein
MAMLKSIMLSMEGGRARNDFSLALAIQEQHCGDHKERSNRTAWHCSSPPPEYSIMIAGLREAMHKLILLFSRSSSKALFNWQIWNLLRYS